MAMKLLLLLLLKGSGASESATNKVKSTYTLRRPHLGPLQL